jgi:sn-glycerol 3-phosphate transport system substrate-binding protein
MVFAFGTCVGKTKVTVWHSLPLGPATETFVQVLSEFQKAHPEIEIEETRVGGYDPTAQKALVAYAGGAAPNIAIFSKVTTPQFVDAGALLPLDDYINRTATMPMSDLIPQMLQASIWNNKIYALPYNSSTPLTMFNRDLFAARGLRPEAPKNWQELEKTASRITHDTNGDGKPDVYGLDFYAMGWYFDTWIGQNGGRVMNSAETEFTFNSKAAVEAMQFIQNLIHDKGLAMTAGADKAFYAGQLGLRNMSTADLGAFMEKAQEVNMDLGAAPVTCNTECWVPIGGANLVMFNTGTKAEKDASWSVMEHVFSTNNLARFSIASGYMASRWSSFRSSLMQEHFQKEPRAKVTYLQLDYAQPRVGVKIPFWSDIEKAYNAAISRVIYKENGNAKQMLDELVQQANAKLAEYLHSKQLSK